MLYRELEAALPLDQEYKRYLEQYSAMSASTRVEAIQIRFTIQLKYIRNPQHLRKFYQPQPPIKRFRLEIKSLVFLHFNLESPPSKLFDGERRDRSAQMTVPELRQSVFYFSLPSG